MADRREEAAPAAVETTTHDWAKIEADYWSEARKSEEEEDRSMMSKYDARTGPLREKHARLLEERQRLTALLQAAKMECDATEAQIDELDLQFEEARQIMANRRAESAASAVAFFELHRGKARSATSRDGYESTTQNGQSINSSKGRTTLPSNGQSHSPVSDTTPTDESFYNVQATVQSSRAASTASSPLSQPPSEINDLTGAEVWDQEGKFLSHVKRIKLDNRFIRHILQVPIKRRVFVRPGRKFTLDHMESIYEPSDAKGAKWLSCMIQATGEEQEVPCNSCKSRAGTWSGCVIVGGSDFPRCANCEWNRQGCAGASYHMERSQDADSHHKAYRQPPESPVLSVQISREGSSAGGWTPVNSGLAQGHTSEPASAPSKRTTLPTKKGSRKSLPNLSANDNEHSDLKDGSAPPGDDAETAQSFEDPGPDITKARLHLRDDGVVFTEPEIMRGVPLERITPDHPYWDPKWEEVETMILEKLEGWKQKLEQCLEQGKNRFLAGRQVNRGKTIMDFLHKSDFHPYQLLNKKYITKGLVNYDTIFRLAQVVEELPKLNVDVTPVEWVRERMHELYEEQGDNFSLNRIVHELYHDPKLKALRLRAGFGNIGRPSGVKKGMTTKGGTLRPKDADGTPSKKRRRTSSSKFKSENEDASLASSPRPRSSSSKRPRMETGHLPTPDAEQKFGDIPSPSEHQQRLASKEGDVGVNDDDDEGYTSTDSYSGDKVMLIDWRIVQMKTRMHTTNPGHTQYWHWVGDKTNSHFEHQVLRTVHPPSWGVYKEPLDFHLRIRELEKVEYAREPDCHKIIVHTRAADGVEYRGPLLVHFKRLRTVHRFLAFVQHKTESFDHEVLQQVSKYV